MLGSLRTFERADLPLVEPWFGDPDTQRYLGGPGWPGMMLELAERAVGQTFRGAVQLAAHRFLASAGGRAVGYIDCGVFDRCAVYAGEGPDGPMIADTIDVPTGSIAFVIDPRSRRRGLGPAMITALNGRPEVSGMELFEAGVEPENLASRRCLQAAGFRVRCEEPNFEGMLYYRAWRAR